ncbi:phytoene desaturase family protein [Arthrobacter castelli]|uniref:phytoene desaturase family protein n=1 Tax=Arthrobacter castelli TaxID=271431 RepID=UPI00041F8913|nr:phytoene desaturase family protein [Arthrobacter castelli]
MSAPSAGPRQHAVIIGAGVAGLASAALLSRSGYDVTVVEKNSNDGGRAGCWESDGFRFDTGPSWYLMPEVFDHFFRLMGTSAEAQLDLSVLDPAYRVYFENHAQPVDLYHGRASNREVFESLETGAGNRLAAYLDSAAETYRLAMKYFLYNTFSSFRALATAEVAKNLPRLARLLLQPLDKFAARYVKDDRLQKILGYPAVFLGSAPSMAPSMYHLMSHFDLDDAVLYPRGGFVRFVEALKKLAAENGARFIYDTEVSAILTNPGRGSGQGARGSTATGVRYRDGGGRTAELDADIVVSAADLHHTETALLPRRLQSYPARYWNNRVAGPGALLIMLGVRGQLPGLLHHNLLFSADWKANFEAIFGKTPTVPEPPSVYVCKPSATDADAAPPGHENVFVLVPLPADPALGSGGVDGGGDERLENIADAVIDQLGAWSGVDDLPQRITVRRTVGPADFAHDFNSWKGTALGPAHILKQSAFLRGRNQSRKVDNLYYCGGSTVPGVGLPMCLISAENLLKRLNGDTTGTPLPEPLERAPEPGRKADLPG